MHPRQALKAQLAAKGVAIPLDTPTPDLEEMLKAVEGFNACLDASNSSLRITCPDGELIGQVPTHRPRSRPSIRKA